MFGGSSAENEQSRAARLRQVVRLAAKRLAASQSVSDDEIVAEHSDLMPELGERLRDLRRVEEARRRAVETDGPACPPDAGSGGRPATADLAAESRPATADLRLRRGDFGRAGIPQWPLPNIPGCDLVREIHRGGQGVVYEARQRSTDRPVAVKVMRGGPFSGPRDRVRFEREVHILAAIRHPNIVAVHDSGEAEGSFYFVMDYIAGQPLDGWIADCRLQIADLKSAAPKIGHLKPLTSGTRWVVPEVKGRSEICNVLRLFVKVCEAVNAAHLRGVIHRDLKPSNILIDASGEPHVLDFGLAKIGTTEDTEDTEGTDLGSAPPRRIFDVAETERGGLGALTVTGQFIGSLPWASPEQAEGDADQVDVRTDVYALGVMLYQALAGRFPYDVSGRMRDVLNRIVTTDPVRLRAHCRDADGEVEAIVHKCLAKAPEQRYQTVGELGRDLRRYLAGEPIEAKRDASRAGWYVVRKTLGRHKLAVGVAAAFVLTVIGFSIAVLLQSRAVRSQRDQAQAARLEAQTHAVAALQERDNARQVARMLERLLTSVDPAKAKGRDVTFLREVLDQAAARVDAELSDQPVLAASLRNTIGLTYLNLGLYTEAEVQLRSAAEIRKRELGDTDRATVQTLEHLARSFWERGEFVEAEILHRDVLARCRAAFGDQDAVTLAIMNNLSTVLKSRGELAESEALCRDALDGLRATLGPADPDTLATLNNLASLLMRDGRLDEAAGLLTEVLDSLRDTLDEPHPQVLTARNNLGEVLRRQGQLEQADRLLTETLALRCEVLGQEHAQTLQSKTNLARLRLEQNRPAEAKELLNGVLDLQRRLLSPDHQDLQSAEDVLAAAQAILGDLAAAEMALRRTVDERRTRYGLDDSRTLTASIQLATTLLKLGRSDEAAEMLADATERAKRTFGPRHEHTAYILAGHAACLVRMGRLDEALAEYTESHELLLETLGAEHEQTRTVADALERVRQKVNAEE